MESTYQITGFQSACAEYQEKPLSLDERYLKNRPATYIIEVQGHSHALGLKMGDRLIIDRSLKPREQQLTLMVQKNQFVLVRFSSKIFIAEDPEIGDFVWGVVRTLLRDNP